MSCPRSRIILPIRAMQCCVYPDHYFALYSSSRSAHYTVTASLTLTILSPPQLASREISPACAGCMSTPYIGWVGLSSLCHEISGVVNFILLQHKLGALFGGGPWACAQSALPAKSGPGWAKLGILFADVSAHRSQDQAQGFGLLGW